MLPKVFTILGLALLGPAASAPGALQSSSEAPLACVERLDLPVFPRVAHAARVIQSLRAAVRLASDGQVDRVTFDAVEQGEKSRPDRMTLFTIPVETNLRASKFFASCGGKTITFIFDFKYPTRWEAGFDVQMVTFVYPNRFEISMTPSALQVRINQPPMLLTGE
jgi:hypothetical protein